MARIQHVTVTVPSEDLVPRVVDFYTQLGGIPLVRPAMLVEDTPGSWLGFGETQVHLIVGDAEPGPAHFALDLGADYDAVIGRLQAAGLPRREARRLWGARRSFVQDPAGNRIELFESPPESIPARLPRDG